MDTLRFITCGSVDDGKSTLIGRLLYETKLIFEDQLEALKADSKKFGTQGERLDFALLVDGLQAEREQKITIDVAYRFFATPQRRFIVADTPGHEQYTRNMATGASTAQAAVLLIDARKGVLTQTKRHSRIVSMLGIRHVALAVNKMDLVDWSQPIFDEIELAYRRFAQDLGFETITAIPLSALEGHNVVDAGNGRDAVVRRAESIAVARRRRSRKARSSAAVRHAGAVGQPAQPRLSRILRTHRQRIGQVRRQRAHQSIRRLQPRQGNRRLGRRQSRGDGGRVRHVGFGRRGRRQPRRRHRDRVTSGRVRRPVRGGSALDERACRCCPGVPTPR